MGDTRKPTIFIGSSVEGLHYANAIFSELERVAEPTVWDQDVFKPTTATLEQLEQLAHSYDFAVLVLTPDDDRKKRSRRSKVPRDNLIAELGLFIGALGRSRVFYVSPRDTEIELPTDFLGITALEYASRDDDNFRAAVRTACTTIRAQISTRGIRPETNVEVLYWPTIADRKKQNVEVPVLIASAEKRIFVSGILLTYIIWHCDEELRKALSRDVLVAIAISENTELLRNYYLRYSPLFQKNLPLAHERYEKFFEGLSDGQRRSFCLHHLEIPLTHSIGLYDNRVFVSELCIDTPSTRCPSYELGPGNPSYELFLKEAKILLSESKCVFGGGTSLFLESLRSELC